MCLLKACLLLTLSIAFVSSIIVELPNGKIQGAVREDYYSFTNLPYAEPPLRFEATTPYERIWKGIWDATKKPVRCIQFGKKNNVSEGQEDCLYLNVFVPKTKNPNLLPVFLFIHGGSFMGGSSDSYSPDIIMAQRSMILVSINYRTGPLGFLSTGDATIPGNFGLKDQLLALRWTKQNIRLFGGDPEKVVLTGISAGGASVHLQMMRKEAENLVSAAASMSGTALNPWVMQKYPKQKTETLANHLKCPVAGAQLKACLQERPIEEIHAAVLKTFAIRGNPFNLFGPVVEAMDVTDAFITEEPRVLIQKGETAQIPLILSYTAEEGAFDAATLLEKDAAGIELIEELNKRWFELAPIFMFYYDEPSEQIKQALSRSLKERYLGKRRFSRKSYRQLQQMFTDVLFANGIRETIDLHRKFGETPMYAYVYGNPHTFGIGNYFAKDLEYQFGATHGDDIQLIMPFEFFTNKAMKRYNDDNISRLMIEMFETFASEGVPRFGNYSMPSNGNTNLPTQYLQILERNYCLGPWEEFGLSQCQTSKCYDYDYSIEILEERK